MRLQLGSSRVYRNLVSTNVSSSVCVHTQPNRQVKVTINKEQTAHLIEVARSKKLFLMEAVWTRFFPITLQIQKLIHKDRILGPLKRVNADYGVAVPATDRLRNAELGGGALLDIGMYVILWVFLTFFQDPDNNLAKPIVHGTIIKERKVDVDEFTTATLYFEKLHAVAVCSTTIAAQTPKQHSIVIQGEKVGYTVVAKEFDMLTPYRQGDMYIHGPPSRPDAYTLHLKGSEPTRHVFSIPGIGMFWEADAIARDIRDGKIEDERCNLAESYALMEVMDEIRKQGGLRFPDRIEYVRK
jgi:predicted dehydrogenase